MQALVSEVAHAHPISAEEMRWCGLEGRSARRRFGPVRGRARGGASRLAQPSIARLTAMTAIPATTP